jgi:exodeoxyribonuclease V alpha subunit
LKIEGYITKIFYNKPGFMVFSLNKKIKIKNLIKDYIELKENDYIEVEGSFVEDNKYGRTFVAQSIVKKENKKKDFNLLPLLITGIGDKKAEEISDTLGEDYFEILKNEPIKIYDFFIASKPKSIISQWKELTETRDYINARDKIAFMSKNIKGLGKKKASEWMKKKDELIKEGFSELEIAYQYWASNTANNIYEQTKKLPLILSLIKEIMELGCTYKVSLYFVSKYRDKSMIELKNNPYLLINEGMTFEDCDEIAMSKLGYEAMSMHRITNGIICVLRRNEGEGNTFMDIDLAIKETCSLLKVKDEEFIRDIIIMNTQFEEPEFILKDNCLYRRIIFFTERKISIMLKNKTIQPKNNVSEGIISFIDNTYLDTDQRNAVIGMIKNNISILTGGPGTGKTSTINILCKALRKMGKTFLLSAPTGRASKRMSEATGEEAKTIHRLLEYKPMGQIGKFLKNENYPLQADYVIIDETSMLDVFLMNSLLKAIKPSTSLIFVGDANQLPSISMGSILRDLKDSGQIPVFELTKIHRQGKESQIILNADNVNNNKPIECKTKSDFAFRNIKSRDTMIKIFESSISKNSEFQVLCPMKIGEFGTESINNYLQSRLNPDSPNKNSIFIYNKLFREGDKVIQLENDYNKEVYNGEMGVISKITDSEVIIEFPDNIPSRITYKHKELRQVDHAWAITIHKSQGSEFPNVVLIIDGSDDFISKELIYTGITRAKKGLILLSTFDIDYYETLKSSNNRATNLKELLSI